MRIGLLSTRDDGGGPAPANAAFALFAGVPIVERQLDLALALGCETIACLIEVLGPEVLALQHRAERAGVRFLPVREARGLSGVVSADDELLVLAAGILPDEGALRRHLARPAVLVFPAEAAVPLGYERIDAEFAWSGALMTRGAVVERLAKLPEDAAIPSALLRLALQAGGRLLPLERRLLESGAWHRPASDGDLAEREARWIRNHAQLTPFSAPGLAVADRIAARSARDLLGSRLARLPWLVAALGGTLAVSAAVFDAPGLGVGFLAGAAFAGAIAQALERIGAAGKRHSPPSLAARTARALFDPLLAALLALASPEDTGWLRLFVPAVLLALLHFGARFAPERWRASFADRVALTFLLAPAAFLGFAQAASAVLALGALAALFLAFARAD